MIGKKNRLFLGLNPSHDLRGKNEEKKVAFHRFEPGLLTLMDIGQYAYNSEWISADVQPEDREHC